jgi:hypothetical protein
LSQPQTPNLPVLAEERCLNCNAVLYGEYCSRCGQHVKHHVHSTAHVAAELFEDLTHADHRVWRTLKPLVLRPGEVTVEYLRGKRASYTPPFRLYIVLSVLFFLTASLSHDDSGTNLLVLNDTGQTYELTEETRDKLDEFLDRVDKEDQEKARQSLEELFKKTPPDQQQQMADGVLNACSRDQLGEVLSKSLPGRDLLLNICEDLAYGKADQLSQTIRDHVPQMLFFLLPVIAMCGKLLYLGSRRYYAEHLLFFVHCHALFFLVGALYNIADWRWGWFKGGWASFASGLLLTALVFYIPIYLYRAMRRVYPQRRWVTRVKFFLLLGGYAWSLFLSFAGLAAITAMMLNSAKPVVSIAVGQ